MMGSGLLAEMKAKQERRAYKVGRANFYCGTSVQDPQVKAAQQGAPTHVHVFGHVQLSAGWSMQLSAFGHKNTKKSGGSEEILGSSWANVLNADTGILLSQKTNSIG